MTTAVMTRQKPEKANGAERRWEASWRWSGMGLLAASLWGSKSVTRISLEPSKTTGNFFPRIVWQRPEAVDAKDQRRRYAQTAFVYAAGVAGGRLWEEESGTRCNFSDFSDRADAIAIIGQDCTQEYWSLMVESTHQHLRQNLDTLRELSDLVLEQEQAIGTALQRLLDKQQPLATS